MTLPASGTISLTQIADEFSLAHDSVFPTAFYGKGGAPASGVLGLSDFYGRSAALTISVSPASVFGASAGAPIYAGPSTVTVSGGTPPYTYAWARFAGDVGPAATASTSATTSFVAGPPAATTYNTKFRCTVTDSSGSPITGTVDVDISITRY